MRSWLMVWTVVALAASPSAVGAQQIRPRMPGDAVYDVRFTFTGATGSTIGASGCPVRNNGTATLAGQVFGNEKVARDDDIEYVGVLRFDVDLDMCEVISGPGGDKLCRLTIVGAASLETEVTAYADDRGGYVQTRRARPGATVTVTGTCDAALAAEERGMSPLETQANLFNGESLKLPSGPLNVGRYADGPMAFEVLSVISRP